MQLGLEADKRPCLPTKTETYHDDHGEDHADAGDPCQEADELERVLRELEVDWLREHDGAHQLALRRREA